jgi:hypothetical protein
MTFQGQTEHIASPKDYDIIQKRQYRKNVRNGATPVLHRGVNQKTVTWSYLRPKDSSQRILEIKIVSEQLSHSYL